MKVIMESVIRQHVATFHDVLAFCQVFSWWHIVRLNSGTRFRIEVSVRLPEGKYVKLLSRKNETIIDVTERLRVSILAELNEC